MEYSIDGIVAEIGNEVEDDEGVLGKNSTSA